MDLSKSYEYFKPEKIGGRVHIIGCGSIGSTVAENLARCGVKKFTLWDFDTVESHNLANQMFLARHVGKPKVEALLDILCEINDEVRQQTRLKPKGWNGEQLSGYLFLCVDSIELRRRIVSEHIGSSNVLAVFDFRTGLEDAQHFAADWSKPEQRKNLLDTMNFSDEEAKAETPVSACNVELGVCPTVRIISALGVANFMNFCNARPIRRVILNDTFGFTLTAFE